MWRTNSQGLKCAETQFKVFSEKKLKSVKGKKIRTGEGHNCKPVPISIALQRSIELAFDFIFVQNNFNRVKTK